MSCDHSAAYLKGLTIRCALCDLRAAERKIKQQQEIVAASMRGHAAAEAKLLAVRAALDQTTKPDTLKPYRTCIHKFKWVDGAKCPYCTVMEQPWPDHFFSRGYD